MAVKNDILKTMSTIRLNRAFDKWYKRNKKRFKYRAIFIKKHWNHIELKFEGITPILVCSITQTGADIWVMYNKEIWDALADFGTFTGRTSWGDYYCNLCPPENREFFPSKQALWEKHCFEQILEWFYNNLVESRWVGLFQIDRCTWVEIKGEEEIGAMRAKEGFVEAFPLVSMRCQDVV
ncbi:MAG: hypothetical protein ABSE95_05160 [Thermodesulfobacteriota bacterium]